MRNYEKNIYKRIKKVQKTVVLIITTRFQKCLHLSPKILTFFQQEKDYCLYLLYHNSKRFISVLHI